MSGRIAVVTFPGTNSEEETARVLCDAGGDARIVHWSDAPTLRAYDAYVLPGGFAYEDRVRAGAIAARDRTMEYVVEAALRGKPVLGICNGAQILLEAGLVPGTGPTRTPAAAFTRNVQGHFVCRRVTIRLCGEPGRSPITASLPREARIAAWAAHGEGRLAAPQDELDRIVRENLIAFRYEGGAPNGSALDAAALFNRAGNVLAIMPHAERENPCVPSAGAALFRSFVAALR